MNITRIQPRPLPVEAMQWNGTDARAAELREWTRQPGAIGGVSPTGFTIMDSEVYTLLGFHKVSDLIVEKYTAVVYDPSEGTWLPMHTGDWILHHRDGRWTVVTPEVLSDNYEPATTPVAL